MAKSICVLSRREVLELREQGTAPRCHEHYHVTRREADTMTGYASENGVRKVVGKDEIHMAEWIGPRQIAIRWAHALRGRSCKYGEFILTQELIHQVMRQHIGLRVSPPEDSLPVTAAAAAD